MTRRTPITVAYGDGIGPEIMRATLDVVLAAEANLEIETIEIGEQVYRRGVDTGMEPTAWDSLRRTQVFLKAPITTPQGGGYKSLNVTIRKALGLFANVRPSTSYHPVVQTSHPHLDVVIIRENEEDLYAGIEHRQTDEVYQCLKLITRPGSEKIIRYAFEYARAHHRTKVSCFVKDNIMKLTDGLFHKVFDEIAQEYPDLTHETWIVDIGAARLANTPELFDVIVLPNLYGDILSDVTAEMCGSVGLAGSANMGEQCAMFEAIHGSSPRLADQDLANPSGLLLAAVMMLVHVEQFAVATRVHNAWLKTMEDGVHTQDVYREGISRQPVGTRGFAEAVIQRLGEKPTLLKPVFYEASPPIVRWSKKAQPQRAVKRLVGVDVFLDWKAGSAHELAGKLQSVSLDVLPLRVITNRGVKVWPGGFPETFCTDHWRCRFLGSDETTLHRGEVVALLQRILDRGLEPIKTENLYLFDGVRGFSEVHG